MCCYELKHQWWWCGGGDGRGGGCGVDAGSGSSNSFTFIIGNPLIIVTIWNVVFANKSWKLGWIWMKLGRWR